MLNSGYALLFLLWLVAALSACSEQPDLKPFTSDGCSLFPDASLITGNDWCSCCFEHDLAYWRGGTAAERARADVQLHDCVLERTQNVPLATVMYEGVKVGGSPQFYNWYRWGYGWNFERQYRKLTSPEATLADSLAHEYIDTAGGRVCQL
ncbi:MAG: hypothetical protein OES38_11490 [Gammaproteobacteria bacterium]|nr:hypothetical protein [Gammaproteobacteria bacterium]